MEEGGNRWSKPHVATLSLHSLFELRSLLMNGCVILDMDAADLPQIVDIMLDKMVAAHQVLLLSRPQPRLHGVERRPPGPAAPLAPATARTAKVLMLHQRPDSLC